MTPSSQPAGYSRRLRAEILHHRTHKENRVARSGPAAQLASPKNTLCGSQTKQRVINTCARFNTSRICALPKKPFSPRPPALPDYEYPPPPATDGESGRFEDRDLLFRGPTSTLARRQIINRSCQSDAIQPSIMSGFAEEAAPDVFWRGPLEV